MDLGELGSWMLVIIGIILCGLAVALWNSPRIMRRYDADYAIKFSNSHPVWERIGVGGFYLFLGMIFIAGGFKVMGAI